MASKQKKRKHGEDIFSRMKEKHIKIVIYTPAKIREKFKEYNMAYDKKFPLMMIAALLAFGALCCYAFSLKLPYIIAVEIAAVLFSLPLLFAMLEERNEHRKFDDINSYMRQFISGMILHKRINAALEDTAVTFVDGQMHETLSRMLMHIRSAKDPRTAERQAFMYMEKTYPNTQSGMIHDFALRVEARGGDFEDEMDMLNKKREKWEKRTEHCQNQMKVTVYASLILYAAMILVCAFVQHAMPEQLSIIDSTMSQFSETLLIILFYVFAIMVERHLAKGWMRGEDTMDDKDAKEALDYLELFNPKQERIKGIIAGTAALAMTVALFFMTKNIYITVAAIIITIAAFNLHNIMKMMVLNKVKQNMRVAVPRWLFDVCLLMQKNNITVSVTESIRTAPPILKRDIVKFLNKLKKSPADVTPYLEFLDQYNIPNVRTTMRMLVSIQNGAAGDSKTQMAQLVEHNMNMLDEIDATNMEFRNAATVKYNIYPMIPCTIVMAGYLISMILKIFDIMSNMI